MHPTEDIRATLSVLDNILSISVENKEPLKYHLGGILGISEKVELNILKQLEQKKVLKIISTTPSGSITYNPPSDRDDPLSFRSAKDDLIFGDRTSSSLSMSINRPATATLEFNRENLMDVLTIYQAKTLSDKSTANTIITKDAEGNFRYMGKTITINGKALSQETKFYKIIDILYTKGNQEGKVTYAVMKRELEKRGEELGGPDEKTRKVVDNAMRNTLFRRAKVGTGLFTNKLPNGEPIVDTYKKGRAFVGWKLNNPIFS